MTKIPANFPKTNENKCYCGREENMEHIYYCEMIRNEDSITLKYDRLYKGTLLEQIQVFRQFETNMKNREKMKNRCCIPGGLSGDPLSVVTVMG